MGGISKFSCSSASWVRVPGFIDPFALALPRTLRPGITSTIAILGLARRGGERSCASAATGL